MLDKLKRMMLGENTKQISPRNLLKPLRDCMEKSRKQMPNGTYNVHNHYSIHISEIDYAQLKPLLSDARLQLEQHLKAERDKRKYGPKGWPLAVEVVQDENLKAGNAQIESVFDDPGPNAIEDEAQDKQITEETELLETIVEDESISLPPTVIEETEDKVVIKTVIVGEMPETEIIPVIYGQLTVEAGDGVGQTFDLTEDQIVVGREGDISISDDDEKPKVSRKHFTLTYQDDGYVLTDTSANGTFANGTRVSEGRVLDDGDLIKAGEIELRYSTSEA